MKSRFKVLTAAFAALLIATVANATNISLRAPSGTNPPNQVQTVNEGLLTVTTGIVSINPTLDTNARDLFGLIRSGWTVVSVPQALGTIGATGTFNLLSGCSATMTGTASTATTLTISNIASCQGQIVSLVVTGASGDSLTYSLASGSMIGTPPAIPTSAVNDTQSFFDDGTNLNFISDSLTVSNAPTQGSASATSTTLAPANEACATASVALTGATTANACVASPTVTLTGAASGTWGCYVSAAGRAVVEYCGHGSTPTPSAFIAALVR